MSMFTSIADKLRGDRYLIPVTIAVMAGFVIGCFAFYEDYQSSLHGYSLLPTRKSGEEVILVIALLPQIGQIVFFYAFGASVETVNGRRRMNYLYFFCGFLPVSV